MQVHEIKQITVVGAGLMGHGIAQEFAVAGYEVHLHDVSEERLQGALENMRGNLQRLRAVGLAAQEPDERVLARIHPSTALEQAAAEADVVIECVFENLAVKQQVFGQLDRLCPERTILTSNTSSLMPSDLAAATRRPDRVLVTHYYNPPYLLPLVEIVRHEGTADETVSAIYALMKGIGKSPALVQKEVPGFVGNRLQVALCREALFLVEQGIATAEDVDTVVRNSFGRRLAVAGPFETWALAGWDLVLPILQNLMPHLASSPEVSPLLEEMVARGEMGVKAGKGFYDWTPESAEALRERLARGLVEIARLSSKT